MIDRWWCMVRFYRKPAAGPDTWQRECYGNIATCESIREIKLRFTTTGATCIDPCYYKCN
jgi:hypothetical protein